MKNLRRPRCIQCGSHNLNPFFAAEQETIAPTEYSHIIIAMCADCKQGQLESTYYDAGDREEVLDQTEWYLLNEGSMARLQGFIEQTGAGVMARFSPCPKPLSPACLCGVHWQLTEALTRLELLIDDEIRKFGSVVGVSFSLNDLGLPRFEMVH